jgi:hypothetical protein
LFVDQATQGGEHLGNDLSLVDHQSILPATLQHEPSVLA